MREYVRDLIHRARQGTDARRAGGGMDGVTGIETLAADAVRLARVAAAVHAGGAAGALLDQGAALTEKRQRRSIAVAASDEHQHGGDLR